MTGSDAEQFVNAIEVTIRAVILNERLRNPESEAALSKARSALSRLLDQNAADRAACWSPLPQVPLVDDQDRARRREAAAEVPHRLK